MQNLSTICFLPTSPPSSSVFHCHISSILYLYWTNHGIPCTLHVFLIPFICGCYLLFLKCPCISLFFFFFSDFSCLFLFWKHPHQSTQRSRLWAKCPTNRRSSCELYCFQRTNIAAIVPNVYLYYSIKYITLQLSLGLSPTTFFISSIFWIPSP